VQAAKKKKRSPQTNKQSIIQKQITTDRG